MTTTGMAALDEALGFFRRHADEATVSGPIPEATITRAERLLGVEFPPTYRRFLRELGAGDLWGQEIYGIVDPTLDQDTGVPSAIWLTQEMRRDGLPRHLLPVYDLGEGTTFGLDLSRAGEHGEAPVVAWHGSAEHTELDAPDFGTFLLHLLRDAE